MKPDVLFVLNEPRNPKNIGASARGMANFGFRSLAVVNPYSAAWRETRSAVNAGPVVESAKKYASLKTALRRAHIVVGTSAGSRRAGTTEWIDLEGLRALTQKAAKTRKKVAIVFGSERFGLSNDDLNHCHHVLRIPTAKDCPSMNLSQAVAVVASAIGVEKAPAPAAAPSTTTPHVTVQHLEKLVEKALAAFDHAGLLNGWTKERRRQRLREAFYRWNVTDVDTAILHGLFAWVRRARAGRSNS